MPLFSGKCYSKARLVGKTAIVTGCNTGIGKETVLDLYRRGGRIIMACRNTKKAEEAMKDIQNKCQGEKELGSIVVTKLDLNSLTSVRQCAKHLIETEPKINILVNNAGVMMCPQGKTEDGFEIQLGVNHLAHYLFTLLLLPRVIQSQPARVVHVSSLAHEPATIDFDDLFYERRRYSALNSYRQSKLANVLFSSELAKKLKEHKIEGVKSYSLHPGAVKTELGRHLDDTYFPGARLLLYPFRLFFKTPEQGAQTTIYCAVDEKCADESGLYYSDCIPKQASKIGRDPVASQKLWDISWNLVGLGKWNPFTAENNPFPAFPSA